MKLVGITATRRLLIAGVVCLGMGVAAAAPAASHDFVDEARAFFSGLVEVTQASRASGGQLNDGAKAKLQDVSSKVDVEKLSQASLGATRWKGLKAADREEFRSVLQQLLETAVFPAAKDISTKPEALKYEPVAAKPGQVRVSGDIERERAGERVSQPLSIVLVFDATSKRVKDAVLDRELISATFKRQFDKALQKQKFSQVLATMRQRVRDAQSPPKK